MKDAKLLTTVMVIWIAILVVLCSSPLHKEVFSTVFIAATKAIGLYLISFAAIAVYRKSETTDPNRRNWLFFGIAFLIYAIGQSVFFYYQAVLIVIAPFPCLADLFIVMSYPLMIVALFSFCRQAGHSGLSLGKPLVFWWPAFLVLALSAVALPLLLTPIINTGGSALELALNIFYPVTSFIVLAPCAVILRFGLKMRGGRVFWVWFPITAGFLLILSADIVFAYLSMLDITDFRRWVDFGYGAGYLLIPRGVWQQRDLLS